MNNVVNIKQEPRERARVTEHHIEHTAYTKYPGNHHGYDDQWNFELFKREFKVEIMYCEDEGKELEIDLIGVGPQIVNAYRRIMLAEVPTMAIEHAFIYNNTSLLQDEFLSHRLGLIPLKADPRKFQFKPTGSKPDELNPKHSLVFSLKAECKKVDNASTVNSARREDLYNDYKVLSERITWEPLEGQAEMFQGEEVIRPVHKDILIAKLSDRQVLDIKLHAVKGIGRDHAKFQPVATASYRLMPDIRLNEEITGELAIKLQDSFSKGVIELEGENKVAVVANSRIDTGSRNVFRFPELKDKVTYDLIKDHYIFKVESTGCMPAIDIFYDACDILTKKCEYFLDQVRSYRFRIDKSTPMVV